jgi:hypothetical protein
MAGTRSPFGEGNQGIVLMNNWAQPIDFFVRRSHFVDHLAPIWRAMNPMMRGAFYVPAYLKDHAIAKGVEPTVLKSRGVNNPMLVTPEGNGPLVVCAYGDLQIAHRKQPKRPMIYLEHGVGLSFNHPAYAGGKGVKRAVSLFLDPNEHVRAKNAKAFPHIHGEVIGTPKLDGVLAPAPIALRALPPNDRFVEPSFRGRKPVVCIAFHWDGKVIAAEAGNALQHYKSVLGELARQNDFTLIGHGHPRIIDELEKIYNPLGIEVVRDFEEVMARADLYVNDCSSTMYEFCATGKPVIILNAPAFRRNVHTGIRFWEYADVGPQVNEAASLLTVIREQLSVCGLDTREEQERATRPPDQYEVARARAVNDLYPYLGCAAERAAEVIQNFVTSKVPPLRTVEFVDGESIGILYMGFGAKAAAAISKSMASLRSIGLSIPVCVVGDTEVNGAQFIPWEGESPFDGTQLKNFQFRAGRVKPFLYGLSPYQRTLYIDADTEFISDIMPGFEMLRDCDMALAEEALSLGKLYNKPRAGWEINIAERDVTIAELGGDPHKKFLNSGVIFFRKSEAVDWLFAEWGTQWRRFEQWDEQLALMRAIVKCSLNYKALPIDWNHPHREKAKIIFHNYGRGVVRMNVAAPIALSGTSPKLQIHERNLGEEVRVTA